MPCVCSFAHTLPYFWFRGVLLTGSVNFARMDHKALGCWTYEVKWKTSEQGQVVPGPRFQNAEVGGAYDFHGVNNILEDVLASCEADLIADANIAERAEESVAMAG